MERRTQDQRRRAGLARTVFSILVGGPAARLAALMICSLPATRAAQPRTTRRSFVRNAALGAVLIVLAELGAGIVRFAWPNKTGVFGRALIVPRASVPPVNGAPFRDTPGHFYLVHTDDGLLALWWKCPHLGCTVPWNEGEQKFHCPCHGSIYLYNGVRIAGPAPRPMDLMAVNVDASGNVVVETGKITQRSGYKPAQAAPYPA